MDKVMRTMVVEGMNDEERAQCWFCNKPAKIFLPVVVADVNMRIKKRVEQSIRLMCGRCVRSRWDGIK